MNTMNTSLSQTKAPVSPPILLGGSTAKIMTGLHRASLQETIKQQVGTAPAIHELQVDLSHEKALIRQDQAVATQNRKILESDKLGIDAKHAQIETLISKLSNSTAVTKGERDADRLNADRYTTELEPHTVKRDGLRNDRVKLDQLFKAFMNTMAEATRLLAELELPNKEPRDTRAIKEQLKSLQKPLEQQKQAYLSACLIYEKELQKLSRVLDKIAVRIAPQQQLRATQAMRAAPQLGGE